MVQQHPDIVPGGHGQIWRAISIQVGGYQSDAGTIEEYRLEVTCPLAPSHSNAVTSNSDINYSVSVEIGDGSRGKYPRDCAYQTVVCPTYRSLAIAKVHAHYCSRRGPSDASNVEFADGRILAYDKKKPTEAMRYIDYGLGLFRKEAFASAPADEPYDLAVLQQDLLRADQLAGYEVFQRFYEIGSLAGLEETRQYLNAQGKR